MKLNKYNKIMKDALIIEINGKKANAEIKLPKINLSLELMPFYIKQIEEALKQVIEEELK